MCKIKIRETFIKDLYLIKPSNKNGITCKYDEKLFYEQGLDMKFVQDNESFSKEEILRGLHIQIKKPQGKLVSVLEGTIFDVAVDLRKNSKTFLKWYGAKLSTANNEMLYIPEGFAHGFLVLSDVAKISFKVSNYWDPNDEVGIPWNDSTLNIKWPLKGRTPIIAEKDKNYIEIKDNTLF